MAEPAFNAASFNRFLGEGKLMAVRCRGCGQFTLPPRPLCPACGSTAMEWAQLSGRGRLLAFTCIAVGTTAMCQEGYDRNNPYCSAIVELEEGAKIAARLTGVNEKDPAAITPGIPLVARFLERGEGKPATLAFTPRL